MKKEVSIPEELQKARLDKALGQLLEGISRETAKKLILSGAVAGQGQAMTDPSYRVSEGEVFEVDHTPVQAEDSLVGEDIPLDIIFEDDHLAVINKPVGLVVHPGAGNHSGTLVHALIGRYGKSLSTLGDAGRPGIVHRLDKDTSGLMVVAKTNEAHQGLAAQFEERSLSRSYMAFVEGLLSPVTGTIDKNIGRSDANRQKMAAFDLKGKPAVTHYETEEVFHSGKSIVASRVKCTLETGRTHQIRVHLADVNHPVIGDPLYGRQRKRAIIERLCDSYGSKHWTYQRQALHAYALKFMHPVTEEAMAFEVPLPEDLLELQEILRLERDTDTL